MTSPEQMKQFGWFLGYPDCCVDHFVDKCHSGISPPSVVGDGPWDGTGFIPCPACAKTIRAGSFEAFVAERIAPNRDKRIKAFPNESRVKALEALS